MTASRVAAVVMLTLAGVMAANVIAGGTLGAKVANGWMVLAYLGAEWVSAKVRQAQPAKQPPTHEEREKRSAAARKAAATRKRNAAAAKAKANGRAPRAPVTNRRRGPRSHTSSTVWPAIPGRFTISVSVRLGGGSTPPQRPREHRKVPAT